MAKVTVLAATGRVGTRLVARLLADGHDVIAVGRDVRKLAILPAAAETRQADFADPSSLTTALIDAHRVACCGNAIHLPAILAVLPTVDRLVVMGSTRRYSVVPDATAQAVRDAEAALAASPIPSVLLLATMIYGGEGVVEQLARLIRRGRILPVPIGHGTRVQPIHIDDVTDCLAAALFSPDAVGTPIVIAGGEVLTYAAMARAIAAAQGRTARILPLPGPLVDLAGRLASVGPLVRIGGALRRLAEDRSFDITEMRRRLGVEPRTFTPGPIDASE